MQDNYGKCCKLKLVEKITATANIALMQVWQDVILFGLTNNTASDYLYSSALLPMPHLTAILQRLPQRCPIFSLTYD
jgi:hypothetical protein